MIRSETLGKDLLVREWVNPSTARGVILLLHGLGDHSGRHDWAAARVMAAGYRAVGFDWPGGGGSEGGRGDLPTVVEAGDLLDEILESLDLAPVGIFAHSTGAFLLLPWLARQRLEHPHLLLLRWIWLSSPLVRPSHGQPRLKITLASALARPFPRMTLSTGVHARDCFHTRADPAIESALARAGVHHRVSLRFATQLLAEEKNLIAAAGEVSPAISVLLTMGGEDGVCPPVYGEELFNRLASSDKTWIQVSGARHEPFRESGSEGFTHAVQAWMDRIQRDFPESMDASSAREL